MKYRIIGSGLRVILVSGLFSILLACGGPGSDTNPDGDAGGDPGGPGNNETPTISRFIATPTPAVSNTPVSYSWDVADGDGDTLTCRLDVDNDGSVDYTIDDCANKTSQSHAFPAAGTYEAKLTVDDGNGGTRDQILSLTVNGAAVNQPPVIAGLSASPNPAVAPANVSLSWSVSDADGDTLTCLIDADGNGADDHTVDDCANNTSQIHTFTGAGSYDARLTVQDGKGGTAQQTVSITLTLPQVVLEAPANLRAVAGDARATLRWDWVMYATGYNLYVASQSGVTPDSYSSLADGAAYLDVSSPFTLTGLGNGKAYYFVVTAVSGGVESAASAEVMARPAAPVDISALIGDSQADRVTQAATTDFDRYQHPQLLIKAPDIAENGAVVPVSLSFDGLAPGPGAFWLVVPGSPQPVVARFLIEAGSIPYVSTRIKMAGADDVIAVYLADGGSTIYTARKYVDVTIGGFGP